MSPVDNRRLALERALAAKAEASQLRAAIRAGGRRGGAVRAAQAVQSADAPMRFFSLLVAIPQVGDVRARQMLGRAQINPAARVDDDLINGRRRALLVGELLAHANVPRRP